VVVIDSRSPRDGAYIERIGHYNPLTDPETVVIDQAEALKWLQRGAQPSEAVARLLSKMGVVNVVDKPQAVKTSQAN
jgi:small subunit ribosomal protein S16